MVDIRPAVAAVAAGHNVRVTWPVGSAPKGDCLGCLGARDGAPPLGKLFGHGVLVKTHPRLMWEGRYVTGPPPGISAMAATRSSGLHGRHLGCFAHPGRSGGNDHGRFRSHFGVQAFEKQSGRPDLNRRPLDPQECTHIPATRAFRYFHR